MSTENYLCNNSLEMDKLKCDIAENGEISNSVLLSEKPEGKKCAYSKSDTLFPQQNKLEIPFEKLDASRRNSSHSLNTKSTINFKTKKKYHRNKKEIEYKPASVNHIEPLPDLCYSEDNMKLYKKSVREKKSEKPAASAKKEIVTTSKNKLKRRRNEANQYKAFNIEKRPKLLKHDERETQSIAGSTQLTLNFFKEMEMFLNKQEQTAIELGMLKNNMQVQLKSQKHDHTKNLDNADKRKRKVEERNNSSITLHIVRYFSLSNYVNIISRLMSKVSSDLSINFCSSKNPESIDKSNTKDICQEKFIRPLNDHKFLSNNMNNNKIIPTDESLAKVEGWIKSSNFESNYVTANEDIDAVKEDFHLDDTDSVITSVTKQWDKKPSKQQIVCEGTQIQNTSTVNSYDSTESLTKLVETLKSSNTVKRITKANESSMKSVLDGRTKYKPESPEQFSTIIEAEEPDILEAKDAEQIHQIQKIDDYPKDTDTCQKFRSSSKQDCSYSRGTVSKSIAKQERKSKKRKSMHKIGTSVIITAFIIIMWETGFLAFILFILDFLWNSEQYGCKNFLFG